MRLSKSQSLQRWLIYTLTVYMDLLKIILCYLQTCFMATDIRAPVFGYRHALLQVHLEPFRPFLLLVMLPSSSKTLVLKKQIKKFIHVPV